MKTILETERTYLREMVDEDWNALSEILQDAEVMYAYEHAFSDQEVTDWLQNQQNRYRQYGFGLWAVIEKKTGRLIGQCGITMQQANNQQVPEIGYLFRRDYWHQGFAIETASACKQYAFDVLNLPKITSIIRDNNYPSQKVAQRNGMHREFTITKHYYGIDMPHYVFSVANPAFQQEKESV